MKFTCAFRWGPVCTKNSWSMQEAFLQKGSERTTAECEHHSRESHENDSHCLPSSRIRLIPKGASKQIHPASAQSNAHCTSDTMKPAVLALICFAVGAATAVAYSVPQTNQVRSLKLFSKFVEMVPEMRLLARVLPIQEQHFWAGAWISAA